VARLRLRIYICGFRETALIWVITAREFVLQGSGDIDEVIWNFNLDLAAGEYIEMKWVTDDIDVTMETVPPAVSPANPTSGRCFCCSNN
jgi:hypothetical protein